jgi:two-component system sensor histidine kinase UhpB
MLWSLAAASAVAAPAASALALASDADVSAVQCRPRVLATEASRAGPADGARPTEGWEPVRLPDVWSKRWPDFDGTVWYRIDWERSCGADKRQPVALGIDGMSITGEVYSNEDLLWRAPLLVEPLSRHWNLPQRWLLPESTLTDGVNTVWVRVVGLSVLTPGLGALRLGPAAEVDAIYRSRLLRQRTVYQIAMGLSAAMGSVFLVVWVLRRRERAFGWYGFMSLCWVAYMSTLQVTSSWPFDSAMGMARANVVVFLLYVVGFCMFTWEFGEQRFPRLQRLLWVSAALSIAAVVWVPYEWVSPVFAVVWCGSVLAYFINCLQFPFHAWRTRDPQHALLALCWLSFVVMGVHDFLLLLDNWSAHESWSAVAGPIATVCMAVLLGGRLAGNMRRIERFNQELEERVGDARQELALLLESAHRQALDHAKLQERMDISHDLHDGLGSSLVRSMALVEQTPQPLSNDRVMSLLKVLRDDLRQVIDSGSSAGAVVPASPKLWAAPMRHRFTRILDELGVESVWSMPDHWQPPPSALQCMALTRLVEEALSNVIKHSRASRVLVHCTQTTPGELRLRIEDNGVGFDVLAVSGAGLSVGVRSMHARMERVGGRLRMDSYPGATVLDVTLALAERGQEGVAGASILRRHARE